MYCKHCGAQLSSEDRNCPACGRKNLIFREGNGFWDILDETEAQHMQLREMQQDQSPQPAPKVQTVSPSIKSREKEPVSSEKAAVEPAFPPALSQKRQHSSGNRILLTISLVLAAAVIVLTAALILSLRRGTEEKCPSDDSENMVNTETVSQENSIQPVLPKFEIKETLAPAESAASDATLFPAEDRKPVSEQELLPPELTQGETTIPYVPDVFEK